MQYKQGRVITCVAGREYHHSPERDYTFSFPFVENGTAVSYKENGELEYSIDYKDGIRDGHMINDFGTGCIMDVGYSKGKQNGLTTFTNYKTKTLIEQIFINDEMQSEEAYYIDIVDDKIIKKSPWWTVPIVNGHKEGEKTEYDREGNIRETTPYVNGSAHGTSITKTDGKDGSDYCQIEYEDGQYKVISRFTRDGRILQKEDRDLDAKFFYDEQQTLVKVFIDPSAKRPNYYITRRIDHENGQIRETCLSNNPEIPPLARIWEVDGPITEEIAAADPGNAARIDQELAFIDNMPHGLTEKYNQSPSVAASFSEAGTEIIKSRDLKTFEAFQLPSRSDKPKFFDN